LINPSLLDTPVKSPLPEEHQLLSTERLLVTDAAGFIGSALLKKLVEYDLDVASSVLHREEANKISETGYKVEILDLPSKHSWSMAVDWYREKGLI